MQLISRVCCGFCGGEGGSCYSSGVTVAAVSATQAIQNHIAASPVVQTRAVLAGENVMLILLKEVNGSQHPDGP